ncbi:MAG TPA: amidohydrolase family protein [Chloroflexota bacterium]|nr:amidohydrolase family protein [Chloroflexota bacterium]
MMLPIVDADGHLDEQPDEIIAYLDPPLRGEAIVGRGHGLFPSWQATENRTRVFLAGEQHSPYRLDPTPEKWLAFADKAGIEQAVIYPTDALAFGMCEDPDVAAHLARAYNSWAHDRYMNFSPRLQCVALIPLQNVPEAVKELRRAHSELDMPAALLPATGLRLPLGDRSFWPVYEEAERLGCFLGVHGGHLARGRDLLTGIKPKVILHHPVGQMVEMVSMMWEGVLETFPRLKVGYLEAGCGWVPYLMDRMDEKWSPNGKSPLKKKPSDYIRDCQIYFSAEPYEHTLALTIKLIGADHLFLASDFPHETDDAGFIRNLEEWRNLTGLREEDHRKILSETARQAYSLAPLTVTA